MTTSSDKAKLTSLNSLKGTRFDPNKGRQYSRGKMEKTAYNLDTFIRRFLHFNLGARIRKGVQKNFPYMKDAESEALAFQIYYTRPVLTVHFYYTDKNASPDSMDIEAVNRVSKDTIAKNMKLIADYREKTYGKYQPKLASDTPHIS